MTHRLGIEEFNKNLIPPDAEFGYWKVAGGVVRMRKFKNGYDASTHVLISDEEIKEIINAASKKEE